MNRQLAHLISDYQKGVNTALHLLQQSGIQLPLTCVDWADSDIPGHGELEGGIRYYKHGYGCAVSLPTGEVDFDFGEKGEIDGFDLWRLSRFAETRLAEYGFETMAALEKSFVDAANLGSLVCEGYSLYYVTDLLRLIPKDALKLLQKNCLPHIDRDSLLRLDASCYLSADLMRKHYLKIDKKKKINGSLSQNERLGFRTYLSSWLGYLHETSEGFKKLNVRLLLQSKRPEEFCELLPELGRLGRLQNLHKSELREFRNSVFHLRDDNNAIGQFFAHDGKRLVWAEELHVAFGKFLAEYRVMCEVHYLCNGRLGESQIRRHSMERRKKLRRTSTDLKQL